MIHIINLILYPLAWGQSEDGWQEAYKSHLNDVFNHAANVLGITFFVASGDNGSGDRDSNSEHADFPAASPYVVGCGGTTLILNNGVISNETVWNNDLGSSGGGISKNIPIPDYQNNLDIPKNPVNNFNGRGVPDVAGVADPNTGYNVIADGKPIQVGGTSAVAPLYAGLFALINQKLWTSSRFY